MTWQLLTDTGSIIAQIKPVSFKVNNRTVTCSLANNMDNKYLKPPFMFKVQPGPSCSKGG